MPNVINFRKELPRSNEARAKPAAASDDADISGLALRITGLRSRAKFEIGSAVLMLDLAAQHAREIAARITEPATKRNFEDHISTIEQLLGLARQMTLKL
jgi:hypothetical protein